MFVVVPKELEHRNVAAAYITGGKNDVPNMNHKEKDEDVILVDKLSQMSKTITVAIKQTPNAPMRFANDPSGRHRSEDSLLAWSWHDFVSDPSLNPEKLINLPMAKGAL